MIDIEAARRRAAWLKFLQPGDSVRFIHGIDDRSGTVVSIENNRIWIEWAIPGDRIRSWVWRDTGDCPGARTRIDPAGPDPDGMSGGWEAA